jgi:hypothetical protein
MFSKIKMVFDVYYEYKKDLKICKKSRVKIFNFWPFEDPNELWFSQFIEERQICSNKKISIYSVFGSRYKMKFDIFRPKIFFTGENLIDRPAYTDHCLDEVNLSLGFDYLSYPNYLRLPLWFLYFIKPCSSLNDIQNWIDEIEIVSSKQLTENRKFCSLISSHDSKGIRKYCFELISKIGFIESAGSFLKNTDDLKLKFHDDKIKYLRQFKYNITFENSNRNGYVTEKIFQSLISGCIPIYYGSHNSPELEILNQTRILFFDPANPNLLLDAILKLNNDNDFKSFVSQKVFIENAAKSIHDKLTQLHQKIENILD